MNKLTELIKSQIRNKGPITFAEFMDLALYYPNLGYYNNRKANIGKEGDFYTSPHVNSAFGRTLGKFILKSFEYLDADNPVIIELGAGKGYLALDILNQIKSMSDSDYERTTYYIVEKSNNSENYIKELLSKHRQKIKRISELDELLENKLHGVVVSNELFDALPFHRLKFIDGEVAEIYLGLEDDGFVETTGLPSGKEIMNYIDGERIDFSDGQEFEINLNTAKVLREIDQALNSGIILSIDYGYLAPELFNPERIKGTYKCLYKHIINEQPYTNIGEQDITAHVDFSNLIEVGKTLGINTVHYTTQGQFLVDWGILDFVNNGNEKEIQAIKNLFLPELMGDKFKVLIQSKINRDIEDFYPESPFKISFNIL